jgi:hypothetical protein
VESPSLDSFRAMACWFSRRSGSRVSIQNPVRRVLRAPSLSRNPMPPRITRKSDRRKASDRTMVGTAQPLCLSASGTERRRCDSNMNLRKRKTHRVSSHDWGWTARLFSRGLTVVREVFVLTSPFIERDYRHVGINQKPDDDKGTYQDLSISQERFVFGTRVNLTTVAHSQSISGVYRVQMD